MATRLRLPLSPLGVVALALSTISCSELSFASKDEAGGDAAYDYGDSDADTDSDSDADSDGYDPEDENDFLKLKPATTNVYVFVANPDRNTVTRVKVPELEVITTTVGISPTVVQTTSDYSKAVTFNAGSDNVSIIDAETLEVTNVDVRDDFNQMKMSPDGVWVACYHDSAIDDEYADDGGAQSFNEVSFVNTVSREHFPMVVGFNPRDVQFTEDGGLAVVVSDAYLALIDLTQNELTPDRIAISDDLIDPPEAEEVLLDPAGAYAIVRQFGTDSLLLVDLVTQDVEEILTGNTPTDLDVTPDGTQAVAVARGSNELWIYDLASPTDAAQVVDLPEGYLFGSVLMSPDSTKGLLYSTASGEAIYASWDRATDDVQVYGLVKPVGSVGVSPTGGTALIFHPKDNGDIDSESEYYNHYALTMIDLGDFFANPIRLPGEPTGYANTDSGAYGYFIMDGQSYLEVLDYNTLLYEEITLKSQPAYVGVLPESETAYASQEHDLGRISFYDAETGTLQTITGFELNNGIEY